MHFRKSPLPNSWSARCWQIQNLITVVSSNIAQPFMLRTLLSETVLAVSLIVGFNILDTWGFCFA